MKLKLPSWSRSRAAFQSIIGTFVFLSVSDFSFASTPTVRPSEDLNVAKFYHFLNFLDVYVEGDLIGACTDIEGRFAAGGSIAIQRFGANGLALSDVSFDGTLVTRDSLGHSVFAGKNFGMLHGSVGHGLGGVSAQERVSMAHFSVGNVSGSDFRFSTLTGSVNGFLSGSQPHFPHEQMQDSMLSILTTFLSAGANSEVSWSPDGGTLQFNASSNSSAVFDIESTKIGRYWEFPVGATNRYTIIVRGESINLDSVLMINAENHWVTIVLPDARMVSIGGISSDLRKDYYATLVAPKAHVDFNFGRLWGGIYSRSLTLDPLRMPWTIFSDCGMSPGKASGGQVNHRPMAASWGLDVLD